MNAYASYTINIIGNDTELKSISKVVAETFDDTSYIGDNPIEISDTDTIVRNGEIRVLAIDMAKAAPNAAFTIQGSRDTSESSGEYEDFLFEYKDGKLSECYSCLYIPLEADEYDSYEDFCDRFDGFSEEDFCFFQTVPHYVLDSGHGEVVAKVPLGEPSIRDIFAKDEPKKIVGTVSSNTEDFVIENSILVEYKGSGENVTIPDEVSEIADNFMQGVFCGHEEIKAVILPACMKKIGAGAFCGCSNLLQISVPENTTVIGAWAFNCCENLKRIELPKAVESIEWMAFSSCDNLEIIIIPNSAVQIGEDVFEGSKKLTIKAPADSTTEEYAKKNGIPFETL